MVRSFCVEVLGVREVICINRAHLLGTSSTVIAHLPDDLDIDYVIIMHRQAT